MNLMKHSKMKLFAFAALLGSSFGALANTTECASLDLRKSEPRLISATIEEISDLTGIDMNSLEWATATNPLFTVVVEDQAIPYHEFGPETENELLTDSGLRIQPNTHSIDIETGDGTVSTFDLSSLSEKKNKLFSQEASTPSHGQTEWWFLIPPTAGAVTCWMAARSCMDECWRRVQACPCGGGSCACGACGKSGSISCDPCPVSPPGDDTIWLP